MPASSHSPAMPTDQARQSARLHIQPRSIVRMTLWPGCCPEFRSSKTREGPTDNRSKRSFGVDGQKELSGRPDSACTDRHNPGYGHLWPSHHSAMRFFVSLRLQVYSAHHESLQRRLIDPEIYRSLPDYLTVREIRVRVEQPGFRTRSVIAVTTFLDPEEFSVSDLATIYRKKWNTELDLRDIKVTLQMDILEYRTPELVRKEIWTHILAYNLIRTIMAQATDTHKIAPRSISFKGTLQTLEGFQPLIAYQNGRGSDHRDMLYHQLLEAIVVHRVANRPDRFEPRARKRDPRKADKLTKPRHEAKRELLKRRSDN